ncbi:MAG: helix-turn-helix domain-containing protein [Conexivisphaerales archaeon]
MEADNRVELMISGLIELGMLPMEARVYVMLLIGGPMGVDTLRAILGLSSSQTNTVLYNMSRRGIIYADTNEGEGIMVADPAKLIGILKKREEVKLKAFNRRAEEVLATLQEGIERRKLPQAGNKEDDFIKYIEGDEIFELMKELINGAKTTIIRIISSKGIVLNMKNGVIDAELEAVKRGASVRAITDINVNNLAYAKKYSESVSLKHFGGSSYLTRFVIVDNSSSIVLTSQPSVFNQDYSAFFTRSRKLISAFNKNFETIWPLSISAEKRISDLIIYGKSNEESKVIKT